MPQAAVKPLLLIFPFDQLAHYLRCLQLAKYLRPRYDIRFAASEKYNDFIKRNGFETFECHSLNAAEVMAKIRRYDFSWINEQDLKQVLDHQIRIIRNYRPCSVLGDTNPTLKMAAEVTGTLYLSLQNAYMSKYYADVRHMSPTHPYFKYLRHLPPRLLHYLTKYGEAAKFRQIHRPFRQLRKHYGLPPLHSYPDELEGDLTLLCDLPELFPQKNLPSNYRWLPPLYYDPADARFDFPRTPDPAKKTIIVSMGSSGDWQSVSFLNDDHFRRYNVITAGDTMGYIRAPHVIKTSFINIHKVFPLADLLICHGGNGTVYQALFYGLPMLCMTAHFEQEWNVTALEKAGLTVHLNGKTRHEIVKLTDEWTCKANDQPQQMFKEKMHAAYQTLCTSAAGISDFIEASVARSRVASFPEYQAAGRSDPSLS